MSGGWAGSDRKSRLPEDWEDRRRFVLRRDNYSCQVIRSKSGQVCGKIARDVDHIVAGDDHSYSNLQACCHWHHRYKSAQEGVEARRAKAASRPEERHPGDRS